MTPRALTLFASSLLVAVLAPVPALAGPPLLCHPFEIGDAESLPWKGGDGWRSPDPDYDLDRLTRDTLALLEPSTPTVVRMETLRRAAIYASDDRAVARRLLTRLMDRTSAEEASAEAEAHAWFDAGYFAATLRQSHVFEPSAAVVAEDVDVYGMIEKSLELSGGDPAIELAAALVAAGERGRSDAYARHAKRALAGVDSDTLLARNIDRLD